MTSPTSTRLETAQSFIQAFVTLSPHGHTSLRTPDCIHIFAPHSIAPPPKTNDQFFAHLTKLREVLSGFPFTVKEIIDNPTSNQVLIWTTASPVWHTYIKGVKGDGGDSGDEKWSYTGEYMFLLTFEPRKGGINEHGEKFQRVERIMEFLDSKGTTKLLGLIEKAREILGELERKDGT